MRTVLIDQMKSDIESQLKQFLREEGMELFIAANDNLPTPRLPRVTLESLEDMPLEDSTLLSEIRLKLGVCGTPRQCETLIDGLYHALNPHRITHGELTVLLTSLHVEQVQRRHRRAFYKRAVMRYIVEETGTPTFDGSLERLLPDKIDAGCA